MTNKPIIGSAPIKPLPENCGRPHPQQYCVCKECSRAKEIITAQHDETGRTWTGPRWKLPARYFEIARPSFSNLLNGAMQRTLR